MINERRVAVATATVWTRPEATRDGDAPALAAPSRLRAWTDGLTPADRSALDGRVETQALLGDRVVVDEERPGWARIVLPGQPSSKDARGYPGWIPVGQLTDPAPAGPGSPAVVRVALTTLCDAPGGAPALTDVSFATTLPVVGPAEAGWLPVRPAGADQPLWVAVGDVDAAPTASPSGDDLIAAASTFLGLAYLWGGTSALGLDCSGLVHLVFRRYGITVPRDAHDQAAAAAVQVDPADAATGDLLFFARPGADIHHVGFCAGAGRMLHAPETGRGVELEPLSDGRRETLVAAGRWR
ncbi:MAG: NlpC/P60 family protein [Actinomycetota bacterium]|nr:NlpC/P60 family protein [Actinomycetota bacterium]